MKLLNFNKNVDLSGYTLIIPSISVGNVPQLTIDLLITTLKLKNVATLWHPGIVPSIGSDPFSNDPDVICSACELYVNEDFKLAALQFRSTIEKKLILKFISNLVDCLVEMKLKGLYILATGFDYELHNIENRGTFYFATNRDNGEEVIKQTSAQVLKTDHRGKFNVSGAGFGIKLFDLIGTKISACMIIKYVSEGDNINDAMLCFSKVQQFIGIDEKAVGTVAIPSSWNYVYGALPPLGLF
ncbi:proteasome assembly chaperone 2 [Euwallacea fornicatus]|uniref:proteasome assembly chaperone 2 n=1 Tax=Euwallacea fornicatus TaxID=995702 RepID=UPI00338F63A0